MRRVLGAIAFFAGWVCLWLSAALGFVASESFGLDHVEGTLPPQGVYGVPGTIIFWALVATAILTALPIILAIFATDASRPLYAGAAAMASAGVLLAFDQLGRAFATGLFCGAGFLVAGAYLTHGVAQAEAEAAAGARIQAGAPETAGVESDTAESSAVEPVTSTAAGGASPTATPATPAPAGPAPATSGKPAGRTRKSPSGTECPWCSARIPVRADSCPSCHAALDRRQTGDALSIPGLTEVSPALRDYAEKAARTKKRSGLMSLLTGDDAELGASIPGPVDKSVLEPPSRAVRAEMARIDREIAGEIPVGDMPGIVASPAHEPTAPEPPADEPPAAPAPPV